MKKFKLMFLFKKTDKDFFIVLLLIVIAAGSVAFKENEVKRAGCFCAPYGGIVANIHFPYTIDPTGPLDGYCSNMQNANVTAPVNLR